MLSLEDFKVTSIIEEKLDVINGGREIFKITIHTDTGDYVDRWFSDGTHTLSGPPVGPNGEK